LIVVDSNIIAYLYAGAGYGPSAAALLEQDQDWVAPLLWRSELRNVLAGGLRRRGLRIEEARAILSEAQALMSGGEYEVDSDTVLDLVNRSDCSAYACEYVALAKKLGLKLVTMDGKVLRTFPEVAVPLSAATASTS
jgi:predicted nucleic acid-binding protein